MLMDYATLPTKRDNWLRLGIPQEDIYNVSDHLVDALFAWGGMK